MYFSKPLNVLIFNDSLDVLHTLEHWFAAHGHRAHTVQLSITRGANEAPQKMIAQHQPHVIIFDVGIPYEANWDFLEGLRMLRTFDGIPVIVTTANKDVLDKLVGPNTAMEMHGLPADLDAIRLAAETAAQNSQP